MSGDFWPLLYRRPKTVSICWRFYHHWAHIAHCTYANENPRFQTWSGRVLCNNKWHLIFHSTMFVWMVAIWAPHSTFCRRQKTYSQLSVLIASIDYIIIICFSLLPETMHNRRTKSFFFWNFECFIVFLAKEKTSIFDKSHMQYANRLHVSRYWIACCKTFLTADCLLVSFYQFSSLLHSNHNRNTIDSIRLRNFRKFSYKFKIVWQKLIFIFEKGN